MAQRPKDLGEYFDDVERHWRALGCWAEPIGNVAIFSEARDTAGRSVGRAVLKANIRFGGFPEAYLSIEDTLRARRRHIEREAYAYDLIVQGRRVKSWHRHHRGDHGHSVGTAGPYPQPRITLKEAVRSSLELVWDRLGGQNS